MDLTFNKQKHLCGKTTIARLYNEGRAFIAFPLRVVYLIEPKTAGERERETVRVLVAAPKKRFRHAVDRNRYRRLLREAYRHQQWRLVDALDAAGMTMDVSFVAVHNRLPSLAEVELCISKAIDKMIAAVDNNQH